MLINSGSGETFTPKITVKDLVKYIKDTKTQKFTIVAVGSYLSSFIGKKIKEVNGVFVKLKGREREPTNQEEYSKYGVMNDIYELASLLLFQKIKEALNSGQNAFWVFQEMKQEMEAIGKIVDDYVVSNSYKRLVDKIVSQHRVILGGLGPAEEAAKMAVIRMQHIKEIRGDRVYLSGPLAPHPRSGDVFIAVSWKKFGEFF